MPDRDTTIIARAVGGTGSNGNANGNTVVGGSSGGGGSWASTGIISAGPSTFDLEARIRTLENQVNILVGALTTTHGRIMQAGPPPENPDPAPTVWERLDEDDPV